MKHENRGEQSTKCICPKCGREHKLWLFWSGRGTPRKYCQSCQNNYADVYDMSMFDAYNNYIPRHPGYAMDNQNGRHPH